jgi:hypothetical protein
MSILIFKGRVVTPASFQGRLRPQHRHVPFIGGAGSSTPGPGRGPAGATVHF